MEEEKNTFLQLFGFRSEKRNRERTEAAAKEDRGCTRLLEAEIEETN